jgi:hypothetical protein
MPETSTETPPTEEAPEGEEQEQTFTQADVDRIVAERLKREREATKTKYGDYDAIKKQAEGAKSLEERVAEIETQATAAEHRALIAEVAVVKGLNESQAKRLVGTTREELLADADVLLEDIGERKKQGNRVPSEGTNPQPKPDEMSEFARNLFDRAKGD